MNVIPAYLLVDNTDNPSNLHFLIINKDDKKRVPIFMNYKDAQNLQYTIKEKSYKIMVVGLDKALEILSDLKKNNKDLSILVHPELEQVNYAQKHVKSINNKNYEFYQKIGKTFKNNKLVKIKEDKEFIYSCNLSNSSFIDILLDTIKKSKQKVIDLLDDNSLFWSDYCRSLSFRFLYDIYGYRSDEIKDCYLIKYDSEYKTNDFHYDSSSICIRIFLNTDFEGGGIEFKKEKYIFKPKEKSIGICYPGNVTHFNRQLAVKSGESYVLTINIK